MQATAMNSPARLGQRGVPLLYYCGFGVPSALALLLLLLHGGIDAAAAAAEASSFAVKASASDDQVPSWEELEKRPLPSWFDEAKFGIFIHWGVFSVPAFRSEWFQENWQGRNNPVYEAFVNKTEHPNFSYQEYATRFRAELYEPTKWADIFAKSGAQYVVLTSKHHEGYCLWNSTNIPTTWNWNSLDVGSRRDLLGELNDAVKRQTSPFTSKQLKFGVYHSLYEWFNPLYLYDKSNQFRTQSFVDLKILPELYDLVERYDPDLVWSDGEWESSSDYWKAREFLYWYGTQSRVANTAVYNDRWGNDTLCKHGGYLTCLDRYMPNSLLTRKWENSFTIDKGSYGLNRNATYEDYYTVKELLMTLVQTVSRNGNLLLNIGPGADGTIDPIFVDRLMGVGDWLKVNGDAIYSTEPWPVCQNETEDSLIYYTTGLGAVGRKDSTGENSDDDKNGRLLYAIFAKWPSGNVLEMNCPIATDKTKVSMLGFPSGGNTTSLSSSRRPILLNHTTRTARGLGGIRVQLPLLTPDLVPCQHAWVLSINNLANIQ